MFRTLLPVASGLLTLSLLFGCGRPAAMDGKPKPAETSKQTPVNNPEQVPATAEKEDSAIEKPGEDLPILVSVDETADIRKALQMKIDVEFDGFPLQQAIDYLAEKSNVIIIVDEVALTEEGIATDEPVGIASKDVTVERVLNHILEPMGLTWIIEDQVVKITTKITAGEEPHMLVRTYRIKQILDVMESQRGEAVSLTSNAGELQFVPFLIGNLDPAVPGIWMRTPKSGAPAEVDTLIEMIMHCTHEPWFDVDQQGGSISAVADLLIVRQTSAGHEKVEMLLEALTAVATRRARGTAIIVRSKYDDDSAERKAKAILSEKGEVEFAEFPLQQAIDYISDYAEIEINIDEVALTEEGIATDELMTLIVRDIPLRSLLNLILEPRGLTTVFRNGVVLVTTEIAAGDSINMSLIVYAVDDILDAGGMDGDALIDLLMTQTSGPWFDLDQEGGEIGAPFRSALVVRHTQKLHAEIAALLADLRRGLKNHEPAPPVDPDEVVTKTYGWTNVAKQGNQLATAIKTVVAPKTWNDTAVILEVGDQLVIRQTRKVHLEIARFVATLGPVARPAPPRLPDLKAAQKEKSADSLYTLAMDFLKEKDIEQARHWLQYLDKIYPSSPAAQRARDVLNGLDLQK